MNCTNSSNLFCDISNSFGFAATAIGTIAVIGITTVSYYFFTNKSNSDVKTICKIAKEIIDLNPTIGDAASYPFVKTYQGYINPQKTKDGSLSAMAAIFRSKAQGEQYGDSPDPILKLGRDLIKKRSGQCDHMAAAVIAKIVEHIRSKEVWNSEVELVGNGGHAFVIINRKGNLTDPKTWGSATVVDSWLAALGVHEKYADQVSSGNNGVITNPNHILNHARFFKAECLKTTYKFTPEILKKLATDSIESSSPTSQVTI